VNGRYQIEQLVSRGRPAIEVCEEAGEKLAQIQEEDEDDYPDDDAVIKKLALYLASTEEFHEAIGGTVTDPSCIYLCKTWISNIHIPGRYSRFGSLKSWFSSEYTTKKLQLKIIAKAECIYHELPAKLKIKGVTGVVSFDPDPQLTTRYRDDIFRYHEMRRRLLSAEKRLH